MLLLLLVCSCFLHGARGNVLKGLLEINGLNSENALGCHTAKEFDEGKGLESEDTKKAIKEEIKPEVKAEEETLADKRLVEHSEVNSNPKWRAHVTAERTAENWQWEAEAGRRKLEAEVSVLSTREVPKKGAVERSHSAHLNSAELGNVGVGTIQPFLELMKSRCRYMAMDVDGMSSESHRFASNDEDSEDDVNGMRDGKTRYPKGRKTYPFGSRRVPPQDSFSKRRDGTRTPSDGLRVKGWETDGVVGARGDSSTLKSPPQLQPMSPNRPLQKSLSAKDANTRDGAEDGVSQQRNELSDPALIRWYSRDPLAPSSDDEKNGSSDGNWSSGWNGRTRFPKTASKKDRKEQFYANGDF